MSSVVAGSLHVAGPLDSHADVRPVIQRLDPAQSVAQPSQPAPRPRTASRPPIAGHAAMDRRDDALPGDRLADPQAWLELHAAELVARLQSWGSELDDREAQLNARLAVQDQRERKFRMQQQAIATETAEQRRSIQRLQAEIESRARRLAFAESSDSSG